VIMGKHKFRICAFLVVFLLSASAGAVLAGTASSNWFNYGPVNGYYYENAAIVVTGSSGAWATTIAETSNKQTVPAGYVGAQARLYNSEGSLKLSSNWMYNSSSNVTGVQPSTSIYTTRGTYYSSGFSQAYNGSGYNNYGTYRSPNQTY